MDWSKGFSASYHMSIVDPDTWRDTSRVEITSGSVSYVSTGLRASADVSCRDFEIGREYWVRVWLTATQGTETVREALFTGLASSTDVTINSKRKEYPVQCYSVLKPAQDTLLIRGWYAPVQTSADVLLRRLLEVCRAPIIVEATAPALRNAIIAQNGESNLSMVDRILTAINWRLMLDGMGNIHLSPKPTAIAATFDPIENDVIEPEVKLSRDWFDCPNVFRAVQEDQTAVARDDSEDSFLSTVNRGREIWMEEDGCEFNDNETIGEYALRRLKEEQSVALAVEYKRRFDPNVHVGDVVRFMYPGAGLEGRYTVLSQSMELGHGATVDEEVIL